VSAQEIVPTMPEEPKQLPVVAHQGHVELLDAAWDLMNGRTLKVRLVEEPGETGVHPFKKFVQRRGGRVGTRFTASFVMVAGDEKKIGPIEVQLAGGGEPLGKGQWVKFWIDADPAHHPFAGFKPRDGDTPGDIFACVFVELDDDDHPIDQKKRSRLEHARDPKAKHELSRLAARLCTSDMFLQYLSEKVFIQHKDKTTGVISQVTAPPEWWAADDHAVRWMRHVTQVQSRSEYDFDPKAAKRFHELVRKPYANWHEVHGDGR
jgi:hypothetical protein